MKTNGWLCIDCGMELGSVIGGELHPSENVPQSGISTRGPNLSVKCPRCGSVKTWYTADTIVRAVYQLIDALSGAIAKRVLFTVADEVQKQKNISRD